MNRIITISLIFFTVLGFSQNTISGSIIDEKNQPVIGANVYIEGTYDGTTSNDKGQFSFSTSEKGMKILIVSFLSYETIKIAIDVSNCKNKIIKLKESINSLETVVINAGTFDAGEKARVSVLKPLDIVTTAGSNANIVAALQTLPGTQTVGEDGRLYVRGGEANETQTYIDGIHVAQPYNATTQNLPTRGRFSPFLFSGMSFSTGGYSAEYGEALSSVLLLNTKEEEVQKKTDIALMTVGLGLANTQVWNKNSLSFNASYINLAPYQVVFPDKVKWNKPYQGLSGETVFRHQFTRGMFKFYAAFDASQFDLNQETINAPYLNRVNLGNNNFYLNSSYKGNFGSGWQIATGMSYGYSTNKIDFNTNTINNNENASHLKLKFKKSFSDRIKLSIGGDYFITKFSENFNDNVTITFNSGYNLKIAAAFAETDIFFSKKLAAKVGFRFSNNELLKETTLAPRISLAYKVAKNSQFSLAFGNFSQAPTQDYLKYADYLGSEKATHSILNFQYSQNKQTFRVETYYKNYSNLIKYNTSLPMYNSVYNNLGKGYATGLDVFWRDGKSFKNFEYWISYSYIDSKRDFRNYTAEVTPSFVASNSLSVVGKYWIEKWKSQVSITNSFTTGRPFNNPNETAFMNGKTKNYNNLSLSWAYLISQQKILYFSMNNVLGTHNIYGYEYANTPDTNGVYQSRAIVPTADRFFFVGFFWTISDNKKDNQLKNL